MNEDQNPNPQAGIAADGAQAPEVQQPEGAMPEAPEMQKPEGAMPEAPAENAPEGM